MKKARSHSLNLFPMNKMPYYYQHQVKNMREKIQMKEGIVKRFR